MNTYSILYCLLNDETDYSARVQANDANEAEAKFRAGLNADDARDVTIMCVEKW